MKSNNPKNLQGAKTRDSIAWEYGISTRTLMRRLNRFGIDLPPGAVLPQEQQRIYEVLGPPSIVFSPSGHKDES